MSYCRVGPDSDVYIWADGDAYHVWLDDGCDPKNLEFPDSPVRLQAVNLRSLLELVCILQAAGWKIPLAVFDRITREMRSK